MESTYIAPSNKPSYEIDMTNLITQNQ
jgi:hypothetical protein